MALIILKTSKISQNHQIDDEKLHHHKLYKVLIQHR